MPVLDHDPFGAAALIDERQVALAAHRPLPRRVLAVEEVQHRERGVGGFVDLERRGEEAGVRLDALERLQVAVQACLKVISAPAPTAPRTPG